MELTLNILRLEILGEKDICMGWLFNDTPGDAVNAYEISNNKYSYKLGEKVPVWRSLAGE